jgi:hypothetical protein
VPEWWQKILGFQGNVSIKVCNDVFKLRMVHWTLGLILKKQQMSTAFSIEKRTFIIEWWPMETNVSPKQKKVCRERLGKKQVVEHSTHFLHVSQVKLLEF